MVEPRSEPLTDREQAFLNFVSQNPGEPCGRGPKELKLSQTTGTRIRLRLMEQGLIREEAGVSKKNMPTKLLSLTPAGENLLEEHRQEVLRSEGGKGPRPLVTLKPGNDPNCKHHFIIEPAEGPTSSGTCNLCGEKRDGFMNSIPDSSLQIPVGA